MDQDGANVRFLTNGDTSVVTPRYSPVSQDVTFMTQRQGEQPRVQVLNIETGQRQVVGNFPDMSSSPRFAPDGQRVVLRCSRAATPISTPSTSARARRRG